MCTVTLQGTWNLNRRVTKCQTLNSGWHLGYMEVLETGQNSHHALIQITKLKQSKLWVILLIQLYHRDYTTAYFRMFFLLIYRLWEKSP